MPDTLEPQTDENPFGELASPVYVSDNPFGDLASPLGEDQGKALGIQLKKNPFKRRRIPGTYDAEGPVPSVQYGPFTPGAVGSGMLQAGLDIGSVLARAVPMGATGDEFQHAAENVDAERQAAADQMGASNFTQGAEQLTRGMVRSLMPMVVTSKTPLPQAFAPAGPIAAGAAIQGSQSLTQARDQGMPEAQARNFALRSAAIEAGTEALASRFLPTVENAIARGIQNGLKPREAMSLAVKMLASEAGQEAATEAGHVTNEWLSGVSEDQHTPGQIAKRLAMAAAQGALMSGAVTGPHVALSIAEQRAQQANAPDTALQSKLDAVQQQYVAGETDRKDTQKWLEQQALQRDQQVSDSAYRQMEAGQRQPRQEADKAALDQYFRERMGQDVQPDTSIGGVRQLPVSPHTELPEHAAPPVEQPAESPTAPMLPNPISEIYDPRAVQAGRESELQAMTLAEVRQEASQLGLPKSLNKGAMIQQILAKEAGPQATKSLLRKKLTDAVSQTQQEMQDAAVTGQEQRGPEYQGTVEGAAPSENGAEVRPEEGSADRHSDSAVQGGEEAVVPAVESVTPKKRKKAEVFDRPTAIKELAGLETWLDTADVTDPAYDSKSIKAQLLAAKLKSDIAPTVETPTAATVSPVASAAEPTGRIGAAALAPLTMSPDALHIAAPGTGTISPLANVGSWFRKWFTSRGNLPQQAFELAEKKDGSIGREMTQLRFEIANLRDAVGDKTGAFKLSPAGAERVNAALRGDPAATTGLPDNVAKAINSLRAHIDTLSRRLIDNGLAEGPLGVTLESNMGTYVTRSYQVFDDPKWKGKVGADVRNKAHAWLKQENPDITDHEVANIIDDILSREGALEYITGRRLGSKNLSITKHRKDIAPEIRALMGEYKDPYVNAARSITKMAHLAANHEFLTSVKDAGLGKFFFDQNDPQRPTGHTAKIAAEASSVMSPLNGLMTTPEIKEAFDAAYGPQGFGDKAVDAVFRMYMKGVLLTKYAKTVASPQATVRNFIGNNLFAIQNGHWRLGKAGAAARATTESLRAELPDGLRRAMGSDESWQDRVKRYAELGLTEGDVHAGELRDTLRDSIIDAPAEVEGNALFQLAKKGGKVLTQVYQAVDTVWKIYAFENEVSRYKSAYETAGVTKSTDEIERQCADIVRNTYPTYSKIPAAVRSLRRFPLVGPFVSFPSEVIRTTFQSFRQTANELNDPVLRRVGAERLAGNLVALAIPAAITAILRAISGVTRDDDDDLREFLPPWSKNSDIGWLYKGTDGRPGWVDLGYTLASSTWRKPLIALMRGDNWQDSFKDAAAEFLQPFLNEEILAGAIIDTMRNKTATGRDVYNPAAFDWDITAAKIAHVAGALEPGAITSARRIADPDRNTALELTAVATGMRISEADVNKSLLQATKEYADTKRSATAMFTQKYTSQRQVAKGEVGQAYGKAEESRQRLFNAMVRKSRAALNLGIPEEGVLATLQSGGLSKDDAKDVVSGKYDAYVPTTEMERRAAQSPEHDQRRAELNPEVTGKLTEQDKAHAVTLAHQVVSSRPKSLTTKEKSEGKTLKQKQDEWQAQREAAKGKLAQSPLGKEVVLQAFSSDVRANMKDRAAESAKIRSFRQQMGWLRQFGEK